MGLLKKHALAKAQGPPASFPAFAGAASRLRAETLHRASVQAGRPLIVLTYSVYVPRANGPAVLPEEQDVLAHMGWANETAGLLNSPCSS